MDEMVVGIRESLTGARGGKLSRADRKMTLALRFPAFVCRIAVRLLQTADGLGCLPAGMIRDDPLFTTVFVANLGSIGLDATYHHLWEYGSCGIFVTIGKLWKREDGRRVVGLRITFDERIEDGLYAHNLMGSFQSGINHGSVQIMRDQMARRGLGMPRG